MATPHPPIAIIGMSFRGPGDAHNIEAYWNMLEQGVSAWSKVPAERWNADAFYHPDVEAVECNNTKGGHFIRQDVSEFDANFFGVQATEAKSMDPQQRTLLEVAWEAFENAGADINDLKESDTGVYIAQFTKDYENNMYKDTRFVPPYGMTGTGTAITANRISYVFDLRGPSFVLDTGCSGSIVALHQACNNLRARESKMVLVGGTNLMLSPDLFQPMSMNRVLNDDGKCYTFDHRGNGYGRGEGVGCVVLKLLDDAIRDGDVVRSIILNTGSNQDGKTNGISLPNQFAQEALIKATYAAIGLDTKHTSYVEAHGTGTQAGDKIEIAAIANTFTEGKDRDTPLVVGSVKTNIGHLEAAAGIAGLIKTVLAMEKGTIPPHLNFEKEREGMHLAARNIKLPLSRIPFPVNADGVRRASVNSFGYGGTNAHTILELPRSAMPKVNGITNGDSESELDRKDSKSGPRLYVFSAKSQKSVLGLVENAKVWVEAHSQASQLCALSKTLLIRRTPFQWRTAVVASTTEDLLTKLGHSVRATKESHTRLSMVFSGQGAQWYAMGRELIFTQSKFRVSILKSDALLQDLGASWNLIEVLSQNEKESIIDRSDVSQPACTALQIALVDLLESLDIRPEDVVGHSSGEMAAAYAAGALTHKAAITAAYHRGFTANAVNTILQTTGAMIAVGLNESAVLPFIEQLTSGKAVVACVNSPKSVTVSGDSQAIDELKDILSSQQDPIFNRKLKVDTAYHSHHMAVVAKRYLESMAGLEYCDTKKGVNFFSSVSGELKQTGFGPQYWVDNLLGQVKFSQTLESLIKSQKTSSSSTTQHLIVEIGPHAALSGPISQTIVSQNFVGFKHLYCAALWRKTNAVSTVLELAGKLFEAGYKVNLNAAAAFSGAADADIVTDLAPYSWDHSSFWAESRLSKEHRFRQHPTHDTLGLRIVHNTLLEPAWRNILKTHALPWLKDHMVDGNIVFPGTGYLCMAFEAMRQINLDRQVTAKTAGYRVRDVFFLKALVLQDDSSVEVQLTLKPAINDRGSSKWENFKILSRSENGTWSEHCRGSITTEFEATAIDEVEGSRELDTEKERLTNLLENVKINGTKQVSNTEAYGLLQSRGNHYGPTFAALTDFCVGNMEGSATVRVPDIPAVMPSQWMSNDKLHAATFDSFFHMHLYLLFQATEITGVMPTTIAEVYISSDLNTAAGDELTTIGSVRIDGARTATCQTYLYQGDQMVLSVIDAELKAVGQSTKKEASDISDQQRSHEVHWEPDVDFISREAIQAEVQESGQKTLSDDEKLRLLDTLSCHHMKNCLEQLEEAKYTPKQQHHIALVDWMKRYMLTEDYAKKIAGPSIESCLEQLEGSGRDVQLLQNVAPYLAQVITGEREAVELMMQGDILYQFYAENLWAAPGNSHIGTYLKAATFKNPEMKIIEIGAGTGGCTIASMEAVSRDPEVWIKGLTFTDISSGFFDKVQPKMEQWSDLVDYQVLDIEKDPETQGFSEGAYDLVLASNVLHATQDIGITLKHVRKLLKAGGRLIMMELTKTTPWLNCIFGATAGWWAGAHEGRIDSPLLSPEQWAVAMRKAGFGDLELQTDILGHAAVYVTSARSNESTISARLLRPLHIITSPSVQTKSQYQSFCVELSKSFEEAGYTPEIIDLPTDPDSSVRYVVIEDGAQPLLQAPTEEIFRKLVKLHAVGDVLWVSAQVEDEFVKNPSKGIMTGFQRVARSEADSRTIQYIDVQENITRCSKHLASTIVSMVISTEQDSPKLARGIEPEYVYRDGQLTIPRILLSSSFNTFAANYKEHIEESLYHQPQQPVRLHVDRPGLLDSLVFVKDELPAQPLGDEMIEIETKACGVNFKDVYIALGQMKANDMMVGEVSGIVKRVGPGCEPTFKVGDRVIAWNASPFASYARVHISRVAALPDRVSFTEGASVPVVFMTAYYALVEKSNLQKGQSVLIHAGSGGVGQAAIQIAQHIGAEIFVTVGSASKKELMKEIYGIPETHIFSSRLRNFKAGIHRLTAGKGVDVILNSLSGEALIDSWACIASMGTFVEIGKTDIYQNTHLGLSPFAKSVSFISFDLGSIAAYRPATTQHSLLQVAALLEQGIIKPVHPVITMPMTSIEDAFRLIQGRKHTGKVVLEAGPDTKVKVRTTPPPSTFENSTFVISGGLGDLGREMCRFLARHGAEHIVTLSRRGADAATVDDVQKEIKSFGTELHALQCDITKEDQVQKAASYCSTLPPVKAMIQAAMVLRDMPLESMQLEDFNTALGPKVLGTQYLTEAFKEAETFIFLSSAAVIVGNRGQANYVAGCAYQDTFAQNSVSKAHTVSLNLPLMFGSAAVNEERRVHLAKQGIIPTTLEEFYILLDYALSADCRKRNIKELVTGLNPDSVQVMVDTAQYATSMFCHVIRTAKSTSDNSDNVNGSSENLKITADLGIEEVHRRLCIAIASRISTLAAMDLEEVGVDLPILDFGLDSLVAIELKNWLTRTFNTTAIETSEILSMPSIKALATMVAQRSQLVTTTESTQANEDLAVVEEKLSEPDIPEHGHACCRRTKKLRKLPLLDLETLFKYHLANHRAIWSEEEYENSCKAAIEFQEPGGIGQKLYARLVERYNTEENWLTEITTRTIYLDRRYSLIKSNVGGSHRIFDTDVSHAQSERAAVIALSAFKFKLDFENGDIEPVVFRDNALCMRGHEWLFHVSREPRHGSDETIKFPSNDTIVVLHRGNVFKMNMMENGRLPSHQELRATFQAILDTPKEDSAITMVTTLERDEWAEVYQRMKLDPINKASMETIETSAFVIALEDTNPTTPQERMQTFLLGDGSNRWYDKSITFTVCANGVSGFLNEHSQIDGATLALLNQPVIYAIRDHKVGALDPSAKPLRFTPCHFTLSPDLPPILSVARQNFLNTVSNIEFELATVSKLGSAFFAAHQLNAAHCWEIITQIASRLFFGRQVAAWTAVLMDMYHLGRPDVVGVCTPVVVSFIDAAIKEIQPGEEEATKKDLRTQFRRCVRELSSAIQLGELGQVHDRTFTAMEWVLRPDEEAPTLFKSDAGYYNSRPRHIMAGQNVGPEAIGEVGFVLMDPKSVWMTYAIFEHGAEYSIVNAGGNASRFADCIARAADIVERFFTD